MGTPDRRVARITLASLAAILLAATWLRLTGIGYDQPYVYHPDEWAVAKRAMTMVRTTDPSPHDFTYPTLLTNAEAIVVAAVHAATGVTLGTTGATGPGGLDATAPSDFRTDQFPYVLWGRMLVAAVGVLTVLAVALAGLEYGRSKRRRDTAATGSSVTTDGEPATETGASRVGWWAALASAAFMALAVLPIDDSRFLTTDGPSALFTALTVAATFAAMARPAGRGADRLLIAAGLCSGLAAGTKYNAGLVLIVPAIAYLARAGSIRALPDWLRAAVRSRTPYLVVLAAAAGFVVSTPAIMFDPIGVLKGIRSVEYHYTVRGHPGFEGNGFSFYIDFLWRSGLGPVLSILTVAGIVYAAIRRRATDLILLTFTAAYFVLISVPLVHFERNFLPLVPFVALLAGRFVADLAIVLRGLVARRWPGLAGPAVAVLMVALAVQPAAAAIGDAQSHNLPDTRTVAAAWADANLPAGSAVVRENYTPQVSTARYHTGFVSSLTAHDVAWYRAQGYRYAIFSSWMYNQYVSAGGASSDYDGFLALPVVYRLQPGPNLGGPSIVVYDLGPATAG